MKTILLLSITIALVISQPTSIPCGASTCDTNSATPVCQDGLCVSCQSNPAACQMFGTVCNMMTGECQAGTQCGPAVCLSDSATPACIQNECKSCTEDFTGSFCVSQDKACDPATGQCVAGQDCQGTICFNDSETPYCGEGGVCIGCFGDSNEDVCVSYGKICNHDTGACIVDTNCDNACTENQTCQYNICIDNLPCNGACTQTQDCVENQCVERQPCNGACTETQDCVENQCVERQPCNGACTETQDCVQNQCVERQPCNGACTETQDCVQNQCVERQPCNGLCTETQDCVQNQCVERQPCNGLCTENQDCVENQCVTRQTQEPCNGQCTETQQCIENVCVEGNNNNLPCNGECTENQQCVENQCVAKENPCDLCTASQQCVEGICVDNDTDCEVPCDVQSNTPLCLKSVSPPTCSACTFDQTFCQNVGLVCDQQSGACVTPLVELIDDGELNSASLLSLGLSFILLVVIL